MLTTCLSVALVGEKTLSSSYYYCSSALCSSHVYTWLEYCRAWCCQYRETRRRIHFRLLVRASAFKLSVKCSTQTTSLLTCCSCDMMYGRNIWIVNKKMPKKSDRNMLTIAAPPRMTTCTTGVGELCCTGTRSSKKSPKSESTSRSSDAVT